ncbi:MAG: nuclear transport factor 2 family protein [Acidimicrobiales bacterium]|nr:nuclear transport factor 2 family protein [Acidimicrobiales bacterium]
MTKSNRDLVVDNLLAFDRFAYDDIADDYAEDGVLHFMQKEPVIGREAIRAFMKQQFAAISNTRIEIHEVYEVGDTVIVERTDHYEYEGHPVSCPICNVTTIQGGEIVLWNEYWDQKFSADQVVAGMKAAKAAGGSGS